MSAVDIAMGPAVGPAAAPVAPILEDPVDKVLSRKRRMNFFDMANLLDSDGNLQNEMLVFAFAATMLSTIPVLLGNEFDVNVGLRRKRETETDDPNQVYSSYQSYAEHSDDFSPAFFSDYTYRNIMTSPPGTLQHSHNDSSTDATQQYAKEESVIELLRELFVWSHGKVKGKPLLPMLINLALDRYHGNPNPADKLVKTSYKKWKSFWQY